MAPWDKILCCSELSYIPPKPQQKFIPPTVASTRHLDLLARRGDQYARKDDQKTPLILKKYNNDGIVSVARFGDASDKTLPIRYFAAWTEEDGTLGGFVEVSKKNVKTAEIQRMLRACNSPRYERYYGKCPNHPNLEFHVQFHTVEEKPMFSSEKAPKEVVRGYLWRRGPELPVVSFKKPGICGDLDYIVDMDYDSHCPECPIPSMFPDPTDWQLMKSTTTAYWRPIEAEDGQTAETDFDNYGWPAPVW